MFHLATFDEIAGIAHGIETTNPAMVDRIRRAADRLNRYEIAARLAQAIAEAADAARAVLAIVHADDFGGAPLASV